MPDTKQLLRETRDRIAPPTDVLGGLDRRRRHQENTKRAAAAVVAIVAALLGLGGWFLLERDAAPKPADDSDELGIFAPVAGRIVYVNDGIDLGYGRGLWAVDPSAPSDTTDGPTVAENVSSGLVRFGAADMIPVGWSSDGTELLFKRTSDDLFPQEYLYILHADGSETQVTTDPMMFGGATIAPDGSRIVFAAWGDDLGIYAVGADGGTPELLVPGGEDLLYAPTFSPDGTQIAFVRGGGDHDHHVWVMDADGTDAHEIVGNETTAVGHAFGLEWSPEGDRIALGLRRFIRSDGPSAIYTFAPDGSDFTQVVNGGISPYWSPDGSQIAYTIPCDEHPDGCSSFDLQQGQESAGLAIADADGSNVREFGFAASGPWHPGVADVDGPAPTPDDVDEGVLRSDGDVLSFTDSSGGPGDLVAVNPETGEERVLVEDLDEVHSASWSADGRWVAYEAPGPEGTGLWVVSASQEPRQVATDASLWMWSSTGADLATIRRTTSSDPYYAGATLETIDPATGETTYAGSIPERFGNHAGAPAWSPDGTRFVFGVRGGAIYSIDVPSGTHSLLARLPGEYLDSVDQIVWSPAGTHIAVMNDGEPGGLYVMDADGSDLRVELEGYSETGVAWSPDGTRLAYEDGSGVIWAAPIDGSAPTEIGRPLPASSADVLISQSGLTWSPDGSQVAFRDIRYLTTGDELVDVSTIAADGSGEAMPIDEITYRSWAGGSYSCECA